MWKINQILKSILFHTTSIHRTESFFSLAHSYFTNWISNLHVFMCFGWWEKVLTVKDPVASFVCITNRLLCLFKEETGGSWKPSIHELMHKHSPPYTLVFAYLVFFLVRNDVLCLKFSASPASHQFLRAS